MISRSCAAMGLAAVLAACASAPADDSIKIVSATPASIELACYDAGLVWGKCPTPQAITDVAERHCQKYGRHAATAEVRSAPVGNSWSLYQCVQ